MRLRITTIRVAIIIALLASALTWIRGERTHAAGSTPPILLIVNASASNPYGAYLGEILRAEGLNSFDIVQLTSLTSATLAPYQLALLAETPLTATQASMLSSYVTGGGRLVAMRPDTQIASLFGISPVGSTQTDGYLAINSSTPSGQGLPSATLQIHGAATRYSLSGATTIAQLYSNASTTTSYPAVVTATSGSGKTAAFAYDLARNIVMTRQGNPANANVDTDGDSVLRTIDLFQASTPGGQPWVDRDRIPIPQADVQQRLFARLIAELLQGVTPLPRLWYFPGSAKTMLIPTGDAHANPSSYYQNQINSIAARNGRMTFYITIAADPSNAEMLNWQSQGNSFGIHPYRYKPDTYPPYNITSLAQGYQVYSDWYAQRFSTAKSRTVRNHQVAWEGWTDAADLAVSHGMSLDANFYHWGPWLQKPDGTWPMGYITGSGQPMKFAKADGTILPYYQQLTQLVDEQLLSAVSAAGYQGLDGPGAIAVSQALMNASQSGDYAAIMTQFHTDYYGLGSPQQWAEGTLDYANSQGIPIWNADQWLTFIEARNATTYNNIVWNTTTKTLSFGMTSQANGQNLTTILPQYYDSLALASVTVDGVPQAFSLQTINGSSVAFVSTLAGNHTFSANYQVAGPTNTPTATSTSTPTSTAVPPTNTPIPPTSTPIMGNNLTYTTLANFGQGCATLNDTAVAAIGDGAVILAGDFRDAYAGSMLDTNLWTSGSWSGNSYTPSLTNGVLSMPGGGYVRSQSTTTRGSIEAVATFGTGAWQHLGYGSLNFGGDIYLIFSTSIGDGNLYARANTGTGEQNLNLGTIPAGMHIYRIDWIAGVTTDQATFLIDGVVRATFTLPSNPVNLYLYQSNNGSTTLTVDTIRRAAPYSVSGSYTSCVVDAQAGNQWSTVSWNSLTPIGTSITLETRTSGDGLTWSAWSSTTNGGILPIAGRYAQYRLTLNTSAVNMTPQIDSVTLGLTASSIPPTNTPTATNTPVPPTNTPTATSTPVPVNLLANPGFELDTNNDTRPDSWTTNSAFTRSNAVVRSGSFAGRHVGSTQGRSYTLVQTVTGIVAGRSYNVDGWVNIPATNTTFTFQIQVRWMNSAGSTLRTDLVRSYTTSTTGWSAASQILAAPTGATRAELRMVVSSLKSTIYVDDFRLQ